MKTTSKIILLLTILVLFSVTGSKAENLLVNGDFTSGLNGWKSLVVGQVTPGSQLKAEPLSESGGKSGKAVRITDTDEVAGLGLIQALPAQAGKVYELTFMSRTTRPNPSMKGPPGYVNVQFLDAKGVWLNNARAATPTGTPTPEELKLIKQDNGPLATPGKGWQPGTVTAKAPEGTVKMMIGFKAGNVGAGTIDISDVVLTQH
jgi:hypothetical protein